MKIIPVVATVALCLAQAVQPARAYKITTHALISQKAYERSMLSPAYPNSTFPVPGFDRLEQASTFDLGPQGAAGWRISMDDRSRTIFSGDVPVSRYAALQEQVLIARLAECGYFPGPFPPPARTHSRPVTWGRTMSAICFPCSIPAIWPIPRSSGSRTPRCRLGLVLRPVPD